MEINNKDLNLNYKLSCNIYHSLSLLKEYCRNTQEIEEVANLTPIINYIHDESDKLLYNIGNLKLGLKERAR